MGTKKKPPAVLDAMIEHVRYEVLQVLDFVTFGNAWCEKLQPEALSRFTQMSLLEAALVHLRCLIEFLGEQPMADQVMARDYLKGWEWKVSDELGHVRDLHGRVAHLGIVRRTVATKGDFSWESWFDKQVPVVLSGFRDFLTRLRKDAPARYQLFVQPRADLPAIDLLPTLDQMFAQW